MSHRNFKYTPTPLIYGYVSRLERTIDERILKTREFSCSAKTLIFVYSSYFMQIIFMCALFLALIYLLFPLFSSSFYLIYSNIFLFIFDVIKILYRVKWTCMSHKQVALSLRYVLFSSSKERKKRQK
jgi:uncharacterized membrane protein